MVFLNKGEAVSIGYLVGPACALAKTGKGGEPLGCVPQAGARLIRVKRYEYEYLILILG